MPKYKTIDGGIAADDKGNPVVINDDGTETGVDAIHLINKIPALNSEAAGHRKKAEELAKQLESFSGIEDPEAAIKAIETVKSLGDKELIDAGEAAKFKEEAINETKKVYEKKIEEIIGKAEALKGQVFKLMVSDRFKSSPVMEKIIIPPDIAKEYFGKNFRVEEREGKRIVVGYMGDNPIYSKERPGEIASFDEALETIIDSYPMKDRILKGSGGRGSGAPGNSGGAGGAKVMQRSAFNELPPVQQMKFIKDGGTLKD